MYISLSCLLAIIVVIEGHVLTTIFRLTSFNITSVRNQVDSSIIASTFASPSLISCGFLCSRLPHGSCVSLYYESATGSCYCNSDVDSQDETEHFGLIHYASLQNFHQKETVDGIDLHIVVWPYKKDCLELHQNGHKEDGVYTISGWNGELAQAQCDMTNGGWTVMQSRHNGSVDFYQNWMTYRMGFGDVFVEYWLGLDNIHNLTKDGSELEVYVEAFPGISPSFGYAHYTYFSIGDKASKYKLNVAGYSGSCADDLGFTNGRQFATYDNDLTVNQCARLFHGAWWFFECFELHLNGKYYNQGTYSYDTTWAHGIQMHSCWLYKSSMMTSKMKIRRNT